MNFLKLLHQSINRSGEAIEGGLSKFKRRMRCSVSDKKNTWTSIQFINHDIHSRLEIHQGPLPDIETD